MASIRYWYADIPIKLIKDQGAGDFDTREIEECFNVGVLDTGKRKFGWGFSKLEPLFLESNEKFLVLDADTAFAGPVLTMLDQYPEPFIVDDETQPPDEIKKLYFDPAALAQLDPSFVPCGKNFNSGQWVGTSGMVTRQDFADVVQWNFPPAIKYPNMFMQGDQGVLNYVLEKSANSGSIGMARAPLMWWAPRDLQDLDIRLMTHCSPYKRIIHWAGCKLYGASPMPRADILDFFEQSYYSKMRGGQFLRRARNWLHYAEHWQKRIMLRLRRSPK